MRRILILCAWLVSPYLLWAQYCGLENDVDIINRPTQPQEILIDITSFLNDDLSDPNQGVCAVNLNFVINNIQAFEVFLESPSGQRVQLIGPQISGFPGLSPLEFDISFVPQAVTANPEFPLPANWNNNNPFPLTTGYSGSYYPFSGNLEDFNTGTVNGQWTLIFSADDPIGGTNTSLPFSLIRDVEIIFCDDEGNPCCDANAGTFIDPAVAACEGDPNLVFSPTPVYAGTPPDINLFGFGYLITSEDGTIEIVTDAPDLTGLPAGNYQVCGLSFDLSDVANIPTSGTGTNINDLRANLASNAAIFCGDISTSCVDVTILGPSPQTNIDTIICDGQVVDICGTQFNATGVYQVTCTNVNGCDSLVELTLEVTNILTTNLDATICGGDSIQISAGGPFYSTTDNFQENFTSIGGCDSVVFLALTVLDSVIIDKDVTICEGEFFVEGSDTLRTSGLYEVVYEDVTLNGCDSFVRVNLEVLDPMAVINPVEDLTCDITSVLLDGGTSTPDGAVAFVWLDSIRQPIGNTSAILVSEPGNYFLTVNQISNGVLCSNETSIVVNQDTTPPIADAGLDQVLDCDQPQAIIGSFNSSQGNNTEYVWTTTNGIFERGQDEIRAIVSAAGSYTLTVRNIDNGCVDSSMVSTTANLDPPVINMEPWINLTCNVSAVQLDASNSLVSPDLVFEWQAQNTGMLSNPAIINPLALSADEYLFILTDTTSGCLDTFIVDVAIDTLKPLIQIAPVTEIVSCNNPIVFIDATASASGPDIAINWQALNGGRIVSDANTLRPGVDTGGVYRLILTSLINGCVDSAEVTVNENFVDVMPVLVKSSDLTCIENTVTVDAKGSFPLVGGNYSWSTTNGNIIGPIDQDIITVDAEGTYEVIVQDIASGCNDSLTIDVVFDTLPPTVEAGNSFALTCDNPTANLNATGSDAGPEFEYTWTGPCILEGANSAAPLIDCAGTYFLTIRNAITGCIAMDSVVILDNTFLPISDAGSDTTINCTNNNILLGTANTTTGIGINYSWSGPDIVNGATTRFPEVNQAGTYILTVSNTATGCFSMDTVVVAVDTIVPIVDAGIDQFINCEDLTAALGSALTSTTPDLVYTWTTTDGRFTGPTDVPITETDSAGIFKLVVNNTRNFCVDSATVNITFDQTIPVSDLGPDQELNCAVNSVTIGTLNTTEGPNIVYNWSGPDCIVSPLDLSQVVVNCEGTYTLEVMDTVNRCSAMDSVLVSLDTVEPMAVLTDSVFIDCSNGQAILDGSLSTNGNARWSFDGNIIAQDQLTITVSDTGIYKLVIEDAVRGCADSTEVIVILDCEIEAIIVEPELLTCDRQTVTLDASTSNTGTDQEAFLWTTENPACIITPNNGPTIEVACPGFYTVVVTNLAVGIVDSQTVFVGIDTIAPRANAGSPSVLSCDNPTATIDASQSSIGLETSFTWYTFDGDTISRDVSTIVDSAGVYIFEIINRDNGCSSTDFVEVSQNFNVPDLSFGNNIFPCEPDTLLLETIATPASDRYQYQWTGPNILDNADSLRVIVGGEGLYRLTVINLENGCITTDSILVESQACPPCVTVNAPETITCNLTSTTLTATLCEPCDGCVFSWSTLDGNIISGENTSAVIIDRAGNYTVTATDTTGLFTVVSVLVPGDTLSPTIDAGENVNLSCSTSTQLLEGRLLSSETVLFEWYPANEPANVLSTTTQAIINVPNDYVFFVENSNTGCFSRDTVTVGLDTISPLAIAGPEQAITCIQDFARLEGENSSSGLTFSYQWSTLDGEILAGATTVNPIVSLPGLYSLVVTNTENGCTAVDQVVVNEQTNPPTIQDIPDSELTCDIPRIDLLGNIPSGGNFQSRWFERNENGDTINIRNNINVNTNRAGTYFFEVTNQETGCINSVVVEISENQTAPTIDAGEDLVLTCAVIQQQLESVVSSGENGLDIAWTTASGQVVQGSNTLEPFVTTPDTYILTVMNPANGCESIDSLEVTLDNIAPELSFDQADGEVISCLQESFDITTAVTTTGGSFAAQWSFVNSGSFVGRTDQPAVTVNAGGEYVLTITDLANGCVNNDTISVLEDFTTPIIALDTLNGTRLNCNIPSLNFDLSNSQNPSQAPITFSYSDSLGGNLLDFFGNPNFEVTEGGSYFLIAENDLTGCRDSVILSVSADFLQPAIQIQSPLPITCERSSVMVDASGTATGNEFSYTWSSTQTFQSQQDPLMIEAQEFGEYQLLVNNLDNGCSDSMVVTVGLDTMRPQIVFAAPMILDCENSVIELTASASPNMDNLDYAWQVELGGQILSGQDSTMVLVNDAGVYSVRVTNLSNGCSAIGSIEVSEDAEPIDDLFFTITPPDCSGNGNASIQIDSVAGGLGPFAFALDNDLFLTQNIFRDLLPDTHVVKVIDSRGCILERQFTITETPDLILELGPDASIDLGDSIRVEALVNRNVDSLVWIPGGGLEDPTNPVQFLKPLETTAYKVFVRDSLNCISEETIIITVNTPESFFAPTAFTPDGDGVNDIFYLFADDDVSRVKNFYIFDRWGTVVFERSDFQANDPNFGWDGKHKGRVMRSAVFIFSAELEFIDGRTEVVSGDFVLLDR